MSQALLDAYLAERELARRRAFADPEFFARRYLSHYLTVAPADFHRELYSFMTLATEDTEVTEAATLKSVSSVQQIIDTNTTKQEFSALATENTQDELGNHKRQFKGISVPSVSSVANCRRFAFAAPRGHAKSTTVTFFFATWALCTERVRFVVIVSDTAAQAEMFLDDIRHELEHNADLREDFGEMVGETWRRDHLELPSGARVLAKGTGAGLRGLRSGSARPDLIICDDIENDENTATPEQRQKVWRWFSRTLVNTLDPNGALWVIGTILHHDALLANLVHGNSDRGIERWPGKVWRALNEMRSADSGMRNVDESMNQSKIQNPTCPPRRKSKIEALWPAMWPIEKLLARKREIGTLAFAQEFQNEPCGPEDAIFKTEWLEHPDAWYAALPNGLDFFQAVDPAISTESSADYFCHVTIGRDPATGDLYLADVIRARMSFDRQVAVVIDQANRWRPVQVAIESVAYQAGLADAVSARAALPLVRIQSPRDKVTRALRLSSIIENRKLKLRRGDAACATLRDELLQFPHASHDDQVDALGYAVELATARAAPRLWVL